MGATVSYIGSRTTAIGSQVLNPVITLPDYATVGLRASLAKNDWRADIYVKNLTDTRGISTYIGSGAPNLRGSKIIIDPRTVGISLTKSFR